MRKLIIIVSIVLLGVVGCGKSRNETQPMDSAAAPTIQPILLVMRGQGSATEFVAKVEGSEADEVKPAEKVVELSFNFSKLEKQLSISDYSLKMGEEIIDSKNSSATVLKYEEQEEADAILEIYIDRDLGEGKGIRYAFYGFLSDSVFRFQYLERSITLGENGMWVEIPQALFDGHFELQQIVEEKKDEVKSEELTTTEPTTEGSTVESTTDGESQDEVIAPVVEEQHEESHEGSLEESK